MNEKHWYLLNNYQHLVRDYERMSVRWLTEEWDGESKEYPAWLKTKTFTIYQIHLPDTPEQLGKSICQNLLHDHRSEVSLPTST